MKLTVTLGVALLMKLALSLGPYQHRLGPRTIKGLPGPLELADREECLLAPPPIGVFPQYIVNKADQYSCLLVHSLKIGTAEIVLQKKALQGRYRPIPGLSKGQRFPEGPNSCPQFSGLYNFLELVLLQPISLAPQFLAQLLMENMLIEIDELPGSPRASQPRGVTCPASPTLAMS